MNDKTLGTVLIVLAIAVLGGVAFWISKALGILDGILSGSQGSSQTPEDIEAQMLAKTACAKVAAFARVRGQTYKTFKKNNPACSVFITKQEYKDLINSDGSQADSNLIDNIVTLALDPGKAGADALRGGT